MISIIVPAHNEENNLKKLVPLLKKMGDDNSFEILIALSSKNSDASEKLLQDFGVRFIKCTRLGRARQMNDAVKESIGDTIVFLHADVVPPKSFLTDIQDAFANGYEAGFFSYRFDKESFLLKINASFTGRDGIFTGGGDQCLFIKKEIFEQLGTFNEEQVLMEDFEFFNRMKRSKVRYKIIKNDLIVSARKYSKNSYVRVNLSNLLLMTLFKLGYPSKKLKSLHNRLLETTY
ncbi:MAG: TIGR04283 family arsenosugar biosynthesis glycosyltransferase [Maribacter sp.]